MLELAGIPFVGRKRHRKAFQSLLELFKSAIPVHMNTGGCKVNRCQSNPAVLEEPL
jgi:hypothetical protein